MFHVPSEKTAALGPGSPISLARFREGRGFVPLEWERCVATAEGLEPTEQLRGFSLKSGIS